LVHWSTTKILEIATSPLSAGDFEPPEHVGDYAVFVG
jgi:hypothetical protein